MDAVSQWANQTLACSAAGCALGAIQGFVGRGGGLPTPVLVTAYGVNALALGGIFFALRGGVLSAAPRPLQPAELRWVSGGAGAAVGLGAWSLAGGGLRRAPAGAALLGALGLAGQLAYEAVDAARGSPSGAGAGAGAGGGGGGGGSGAAPAPASPAPARANVAWLPVSLSPTASDAARLLKERRRLVELDQVLGLAPPAVHPKAVELAAREEAALKAMAARSSSPAAQQA